MLLEQICLSRVVEGIGPVKPSNLPIGVVLNPTGNRKITKRQSVFRLLFLVCRAWHISSW